MSGYMMDWDRVAIELINEVGFGYEIILDGMNEGDFKSRNFQAVIDCLEDGALTAEEACRWDLAKDCRKLAKRLTLSLVVNRYGSFADLRKEAVILRDHLVAAAYRPAMPNRDAVWNGPGRFWTKKDARHISFTVCGI